MSYFLASLAITVAAVGGIVWAEYTRHRELREMREAADARRKLLEGKQ